jgi:hypothetical protein
MKTQKGGKISTRLRSYVYFQLKAGEREDVWIASKRTTHALADKLKQKRSTSRHREQIMARQKLVSKITW